MRQGNWDKLIEESERMNAEIDQKLSKEEEDLRKEQQVSVIIYMMAHRKSANDRLLCT